MRNLLARTVILEGITHIEDLPLEKFISTLEELQHKVVTEKLDGANLWFGVDDKGFFTSREGKRKNSPRFYQVSDYPVIASYNAFRAAHAALEEEQDTIKNILSVGDMVEVEVLFGKQPNTVTYGAGDFNYIVILRGIGTNPDKVNKLADALDNTTVEIKSTVVSSKDGDSLDLDEEYLTWKFTQVKPIDSVKFDSAAVKDKLDELKKYLTRKNAQFPTMSNREVSDINLGSVDKMKRETMKAERTNVLSTILNDYKIPIKDLLLNNFVRKIKPHLQSKNLEPSEDVGIEGVVIRDKNSDDQVKVVDKDVFTAINTFNNFIRGSISGVVRTDDQDVPVELRGGAFGQAKIRIANLLGVKELAVSSTSKKILSKFKGDDPTETAEKLSASLNIENFSAVKHKIVAILDNALEDVKEVLVKFKEESGSYKLKLKTGKEIGLSKDVINRNLTAFAETQRDIKEIRGTVSKSNDPTELVLALYGRTIQSLFNGSDDMKESFSLLKTINENNHHHTRNTCPTCKEVTTCRCMANKIETSIVCPKCKSLSEDEAAGGEQTPATVSGDISPNIKRVFNGGKQIIKRTRNFSQRKKFPKPTNESLLKIVEFEISNQNATDVDDLAAARNDIEFKQLRNNVTLGSSITDNDVNKYLDKAHELNDEVDTVTFGLELDDGSVVKVYVNASEADGFEDAMAQMLGEYDDIEEAIDQLAQTFDIVDVEWPENNKGDQTQVEPEGEPQEPQDAENQDNLNTDQSQPEEPAVEPVIDIGADTISPESKSSSDTETGDMSFDTTIFSDGDDDSVNDANDEAPSTDNENQTASDDSTAADIESTTDSDTSSDEENDESSTGDESPTDDKTAVKTKPKKKADGDEDDEPSDEDSTPLKKEDLQMPTTGQLFKQKLLEKKSQPKTKKDDELLDDNDEKAHEGLPPRLKKLLTSFPTRGEKAMVVLMFALGAPLDALVLKKADLRKNVEESGEMYMKNSQFRLWVTRLTTEMLKVQTSESSLEDELGSTLQRIIIEIMQSIGLPASIEKMARSTLRANIRARAKLASGDAKIRQYLKLLAEMLGIDATTGLVKEAKNHMGETEYNTWASWRSACKKKNPNVWFDGDKDIAQAMVGEKPFKAGKTSAIGEWDGEKGSVFNHVDANGEKLKEAADTPKFTTGKYKVGKNNGDWTKGEILFINKVYPVATSGLLKGHITYSVKLSDGGSDRFAENELTGLDLRKVAMTDDDDMYEAAPALANPQASIEDEETGNEWVDEILKLAEALGIPQGNLDYRKTQVIMSLKKNRQSISNYSLVLRNIKKLNQIIGSSKM